MKQTAIQISMINNINNSDNNGEQLMTSLEIAALTGKKHCHVMEAIRKMELAWKKVNESNFRLVEYQDNKGELRPCYLLTRPYQHMGLTENRYRYVHGLNGRRKQESYLVWTDEGREFIKEMVY